MEVLPGLEISLEAILLALIFLLMLARFVFDIRGGTGRDLGWHSARLAHSLNDPDLDEKLERAILLEAALAARIEEKFEFFGDMPNAELAVRFAQAGYRTSEELFFDRVRGVFTRENAARVGGKLMDKVLKLLNKYLGLG